MTAQLEDLRSQFQALSERARALSLVSPARLMERPAPEKWSAAECLEHLRLSSEPYFALLDQAFEQARGKAGLLAPGPFQRDFWGRMLEWFLEPPPKFRFGAPPRFQPVQIAAPERVLEEFLASQEQLIARVERADGLALDKIKIVSPFDPRGKLKYNVLSCFRIHTAHQRRHLLQAERALEARQ